MFDQAEAYLLFRVADEQYALPSGSVHEIVRWQAAVPVPGAPTILPGILVQRGVVYTVVDTRLLFGFATTAPERATRYVLFHEDEHRLALLVDAVLDLIALDLTLSEAIPATLPVARARLLRGVVRHTDLLVALIEPPELLAALYAEV